MTACAYRSLEPVLRQRVAELRERRERDVMFVEVARGVASRRLGRAVGGAVGVAFGVAAFLAGLATFWNHDSPASHAMQVGSTELLLIAWPLALAAGAAARWVARALLARRARVAMSGEPALDLRALEAADPLRDACDRAMAWERASAALPLAALSLLAPLTLHGVVWAGLAHGESLSSAMQDFGAWIGLSAILVGHAHLALLICAVRWAFKLRTRETAELHVGVHRAWGKALAISGATACLPGLVLLAVPPLLVVATGLLFVPLMYVCTARTLTRERIALEAV